MSRSRRVRSLPTRLAREPTVLKAADVYAARVKPQTNDGVDKVKDVLSDAWPAGVAASVSHGPNGTLLPACNRLASSSAKRPRATLVASRACSMALSVKPSSRRKPPRGVGAMLDCEAATDHGALREPTESTVSSGGRFQAFRTLPGAPRRCADLCSRVRDRLIGGVYDTNPNDARPSYAPGFSQLKSFPPGADADRRSGRSLHGSTQRHLPFRAPTPQLAMLRASILGGRFISLRLGAVVDSSHRRRGLRGGRPGPRRGHR